jgi:uncharacterized protein (TIGR03435 family)
MKAIRFIALIGLAAVSLYAQSSPLPEFEVASIRPSTETPQGQVNIGLHIDGAQVRVASMTFKDYLGLAYRMKVSNISGPDWISSERFDISATIPAGGKTAQIPEMFQALLAKRFQLKVHREKKEFPVYALVIGKGELKLKEVPPDDDKGKTAEPINVAGGGSAAGVSVNLGNGSSWSFVPNRFEAKKLTMEQFASNLERFADRQIVDMTGLKGQYDLAFDINPEDYRPMLIRSAISAGAMLPPQALKLVEGTSSASISDALQQIGLRLEARKAPLDVIVVDDAKKTPTEN